MSGKRKKINSLINLGELDTEPLIGRPVCPYCGRGRVIKMRDRVEWGPCRAL